ncbi:putative papain-like cysteine peptidase [Indivirus ILV1]|uniref:Putative papain-like cysteine peptidase n=1 Tax=Indivirus ILV1 TaxID=1977633 RepID=A0A1V0SEE8_9VIRU|nr:putative papain-like cysteine peptidase [Indivirus ILV1]
MTTYIPLGSACSIAYQLQKLGLRKCAFPFDWLRIDRLCDITEAIKNEFCNFLKLDEVEISEKFSIIDDDFIENNKKSKIMKNKYGMKFYHDFDANVNDYKDVYEKYNRRIVRFIEIVKSPTEICFVRDEIYMNKINVDQVEKFIEYIKQFNKNIKLIIIIHNPKNKKSDIFEYKNKNVIIINDINPFGDWKRPNVEWNLIFSIYKNKMDSIPKHFQLNNYPENLLIQVE